MVGVKQAQHRAVLFARPSRPVWPEVVVFAAHVRSHLAHSPWRSRLLISKTFRGTVVLWLDVVMVSRR